MAILSALLGVTLILVVLGDAFETIILPRRADNWQTSTWGRSTGFEIDGLPEGVHDEHFL